MTQNEFRNLLLSVVDDVNLLNYYRHYLKIALELLESPNHETVDRVELLVSTFLQQVECRFENLDSSFKVIVQACQTNLPEEDD